MSKDVNFEAKKMYSRRKHAKTCLNNGEIKTEKEKKLF